MYVYVYVYVYVWIYQSWKVNSLQINTPLIMA